MSQRQSAKQWIELHSSGLDPSVVRVNVMIRVIDVVKWHMGVKSGSSERGVSGEDGQQQPLTPHSVLLLLPFCESWDGGRYVGSALILQVLDQKHYCCLTGR